MTKWVNVLKSDQFVHRVVGLFDSEADAARWAFASDEGMDWYHWYQCEFEFIQEGE